jgi:branched-chain amino acid transport system substrate-binding protein
LVAALDKAGKDITREKLLDTFEAMSKLDLGGIAMSFSAVDHQGSHSVYLTVV